MVNSSCLNHCFRETALACHMHLAGFPEETILVLLFSLSDCSIHSTILQPIV